MRVILTLEIYGNKHFNYPGMKRKPAIIRAIEAVRNDIYLSGKPIIDIRTSQK
ncbi:hypothetical protein [Cohnella nanjingensis]|uniref:Uncharacterized protein n=1 Tax=Cohnella nanjingensis TaxID=1387779 RepID=A0A7X0VGQ2_9BACL|nr:hypothetical protein [Cohnella nanjingensis]MBB6672608.1 hypothetical protein [Cohnella nanjingensis]